MDSDQAEPFGVANCILGRCSTDTRKSCDPIERHLAAALCFDLAADDGEHGSFALRELSGDA
ncbi:MAG: hypothetical protein WCH83_16555 [Alphaproteobacteria bacterium]